MVSQTLLNEIAAESALPINAMAIEAQVAQMMEEHDLQSHGITPQMLVAMQNLATYVRSTFPSLQRVVFPSPNTPLLDVRGLTAQMLFKDLLERVMRCVRRYIGARVGTVTIMTPHIWVSCKQLCSRHGHWLPLHFAPRWANHVSHAADDVFKYFVEEDPGARRTAVVAFLQRLWNHFLSDSSAAVAVKQRRTRSDAGKKRPRGGDGEPSTPSTVAADAETPNIDPCDEQPASDSLLVRRLMTPDELAKLDFLEY
jgi:hypothetical protein